jgi:hypothetical protein
MVYSFNWSPRPARVSFHHITQERLLAFGVVKGLAREDLVEPWATTSALGTDAAAGSGSLAPGVLGCCIIGDRPTLYSFATPFVSG